MAIPEGVLPVTRTYFHTLTIADSLSIWSGANNLPPGMFRVEIANPNLAITVEYALSQLILDFTGAPNASLLTDIERDGHITLSSPSGTIYSGTFAGGTSDPYFLPMDAAGLAAAAAAGAARQSIDLTILVPVSVDGAIAYEAGTPSEAVTVGVQLPSVDAAPEFTASKQIPTIWGQFEWGEAQWDWTDIRPSIDVTITGINIDGSVDFQGEEAVFVVAAEALITADADVASEAGSPTLGVAAEGRRDLREALRAGAPALVPGVNGDLPLGISYQSNRRNRRRFRPQVAVAADVLTPVNADAAFDAGTPTVSATADVDKVDAPIAFEAGAPTVRAGVQAISRGEIAFDTGTPEVRVRPVAHWINVAAGFEAGAPAVAVAAEQDRVDAGVDFEAGAPAVVPGVRGTRDATVAFEAGTPAVAATADRDKVDGAIAFETGSPDVAASGNGDLPVAISYQSNRRNRPRFRPRVAVVADTVEPVGTAIAYRAGAPAVSAAVEQDRLDVTPAFRAGPPAVRAAGQALAQGQVAFEAGSPDVRVQAVAQWVNVSAVFDTGRPDFAVDAHGDLPISIIYRSNFRNRQARRWKPRFRNRPDTIGPVDAAIAFGAGTPAVAVFADRDKTDADIAFEAEAPTVRVQSQAITQGEIAFEAGAPEVLARAVTQWVDAEIAFESGAPAVAAAPEQDRLDVTLAYGSEAPTVGVVVHVDKHVAPVIRSGNPAVTAQAFAHWRNLAIAYRAGTPTETVAGDQDRLDLSAAFRAGAPTAMVVSQALTQGEIAYSAGAPTVTVVPVAQWINVEIAFETGSPAVATVPRGELPLEILYRSNFRGRTGRRWNPRFQVRPGTIGPVDADVAFGAGAPTVSVAPEQDRVDAAPAYRAGTPVIRVVSQAITQGEIAFEAGAPEIRARPVQNWVNVAAAFEAGSPTVAAAAEQDRVDAAATFSAGSPAVGVALQIDKHVTPAFRADPPTVRVQSQAITQGEIAYETGTPEIAVDAEQDPVDIGMTYRAGAPTVVPGARGIRDAAAAFDAVAPDVAVRAVAHWINAGAAFEAGAPDAQARAVAQWINVEIAFETGAPAVAAVPRGELPLDILYRSNFRGRTGRRWNPRIRVRPGTIGPVDVDVAFGAGAPTVVVAADVDKVDAPIAFEARSPAVRAGVQALARGQVALEAGLPTVTVGPVAHWVNAAAGFDAGTPGIAVDAEQGPGRCRNGLPRRRADSPG